MFIRNAVLLVTVALVGTGCSTNYPVTWDSIPQGATVMCGQAHMGETPVTKYTDKDKVQQFYPNLPTSACHARWVSGHTERYSDVSLPKYPNGVTITVRRPYDDGYKEDINHALRLKQLEIQERQAEAAEKTSNNNGSGSDFGTCITGVAGITNCF